MTTTGRSPAAVVAAPVKVWAPDPRCSRVPVPPSNVEAWLTSPAARTVPVPMVPSVRVRVPPDGEGVAGGDGVGRAGAVEHDVGQRLAAGDRLGPREDDRGGARVERARGVRPVVGGADRAGQGERAGGLVDDDRGQGPGGGRGRAGERLGAGRRRRGACPCRRRTWTAWLMLPGRRRVPVPLMVPSVRRRAGRRGRRSGCRAGTRCREVRSPGHWSTATLLSVCEPVIVPPAKTTVEVPGSSVPAVYVQSLAVRIVPARVSVPEGLLMTTTGRSPAVGRGRAGERLGAGAVDEQRAPSPPSNVEAWLRSPRACSVPVPLRVPSVRRWDRRP